MRPLSILREALNRVTGAAASVLASAGVVCVVSMMLIVTVDVIARYVFNAPTVWAGEIASYLLIGIVFLGLAHNLREGSHIRIDVVTGFLPHRVRSVLEGVTYAIGSVFSIVLFLGAWTRFANFWDRHTTSDSPLMTPLWLPMVPVLLGAAVLCIAMLVGFAASFSAVMDRRPEPGGADA
jgi:C4-dicarboxylate transporter, DctQ subunit